MSRHRETLLDRIKVILFAAGSDGDIHPHLGLGHELMARGHEVLFLTTFDYVEMAREHGFEVLSIMGPDDKQEFEQAESLKPMAKFKARCRFFSSKLAKICDLAAGELKERTILVSPPFGYAAAKLLHLRYGVPYVSTVLSPASLCSLRNPPAFKGGEWFSRLPYPARKVLFRSAEQVVVDTVFRRLLKDLFQEMDLPKPHRVLSKWSYSPQRILGLFPDWFCPKPDDWPDQLVFTGFPLFHPVSNQGGDTGELPLELSRYLDAGVPPVVFTAGTETRDARAFFETALKAAESLGTRGIFLTRLTDQLPPLPATIRHERYLPLHLLLPKASVFVHHGGIGTAAQCLRARVPQLVIPERLDQFDNGQHIERLGCGLVQRNAFDSDAIAKKLQYLLTEPAVRDACRSAQARMEPGTVVRSRAADVIEETCRAALRTSSRRIDARSSAWTSLENPVTRSPGRRAVRRRAE